MCEMIKNAVGKVASAHQVNNLIACGRTVLLDGFLEMLESDIGISVKLGRISNPDIIYLFGQDDILSRQKYLPYVTALGIVCQALKKERPQTLSNYKPAANFLAKSINRVKEIYQEYF